VNLRNDGKTGKYSQWNNVATINPEVFVGGGTGYGYGNHVEFEGEGSSYSGRSSTANFGPFYNNAPIDKVDAILSFTSSVVSLASIAYLPLRGVGFMITGAQVGRYYLRVTTCL
jgi:hypothetical protein